MPEETGKSRQAWLPRFLQRLRLREHQTFLALTISIGLLAGVAAVLLAAYRA